MFVCCMYACVFINGGTRQVCSCADQFSGLSILRPARLKEEKGALPRLCVCDPYSSSELLCGGGACPPLFAEHGASKVKVPLSDPPLRA